ncbi:MAG: Coenzyme F420 hydrogenase/dehydrogenase, beta subunit C-terminal domain [Ruminococcus sp.]|nr:Coenzyme F420 hydrogenase/dehydrogenase, beta subunit C-terminal domain [Ruminococcus sp.]
MAYLQSGQKTECCGCGLCVVKCPQKAISMLSDEEGFLYPKIDTEKCTNCGLCNRICIHNTTHELNYPISAWAAICKFDSILLESSSGGAFYAITKACSESTMIYGASWNGRSQVIHKGVAAPRAYEAFRKSKYIQSHILSIFSQINTELKQGKQVVFTGTPCQCAALKSFLNVEYDNLLLVDLICHGVSNGQILEYCLKCFDRRHDKISQISFRHKEKVNGHWNSKLLKLKYMSEKTKILDYNTCGFLRGYDNGYLFRPSCHICPYAQINRISDITLGDYWGGEKKGFDPHHGASLILINTNKGNIFWEMMKNQLEVQTIDLNYASSHNKRLNAPDAGNPNREQFLHELFSSSSDFEKTIQKYVPRIPKWKIWAHRIKNEFFDH